MILFKVRSTCSKEDKNLYSRWLHKSILEKYHNEDFSLRIDNGRLWYSIKLDLYG